MTAPPVRPPSSQRQSPSVVECVSSVRRLTVAVPLSFPGGYDSEAGGRSRDVHAGGCQANRWFKRVTTS